MTPVSKQLTRLMRLRNGRQLLSFGKERGISGERMRYIVKLVQLLRSPRELVRRRWLGKRVQQHHPPRFDMPDEAGFVRFSADSFTGGADLVEVCRRIHKDFGPATAASSNKPFLINILSEDDLYRYPQIAAFACDPSLLATVARYLGTLPSIADIQLWSSNPTGVEDTGSQLFHRDNEDFRQAKVLVNIYDVTSESGPLTVLPASVSERAAPKLRTRLTRTPDDEMFRHCSTQDAVPLEGRAGEAVIVDTSRCFHYGSRTRGGERLILMIHYLSYHSVLEAITKTLQPDSAFRRINRDNAFSRAALQVRPLRV